MPKMKGARWVPGQPFLAPKVSNAIIAKSNADGVEGSASAAAASGGGEHLEMVENGMALVLVLAQDPNVKIEKGIYWLGKARYYIIISCAAEVTYLRSKYYIYSSFVRLTYVHHSELLHVSLFPYSIGWFKFSTTQCSIEYLIVGVIA